MLDAIQRMRLERRWAIIFLGLFIAVALLVQWLGGEATPEATHDSPPVHTETAP